MRLQSLLVLLLLTALVGQPVSQTMAQEPAPSQSHLVDIGDTWTALAYRYGTSVAFLQAINGWVNIQRQPAVGSYIQLAQPESESQNGQLIRPTGGMLGASVQLLGNPWILAVRAGMAHPYEPVLDRAVFQPGGQLAPTDLPAGFKALELSSGPALPGRALALRGQLTEPGEPQARLDDQRWLSFRNGDRFVVIGGTGAFFPPGDHDLLIVSEGRPAWAQPLRFEAGTWTFQDITLTGAAAQIDQESIRLERERLQAIWGSAGASPLWDNAFETPVATFLGISSYYGARRSYNGGPYRTYHEGVDFSAYGGTPVYAAAAGRVALAETLYVRGGTVLIDHGLGVFSGYYHLSEVIARPEQVVAAGELIGRVGTTGLSTGNHLHWDLLVGGLWIDAAAWQADRLDCWILEGWGSPCAASDTSG